jgi:hypothetical protein
MPALISVNVQSLMRKKTQRPVVDAQEDDESLARREPAHVAQHQLEPDVPRSPAAKELLERGARQHGLEVGALGHGVTPGAADSAQARRAHRLPRSRIGPSP